MTNKAASIIILTLGATRLAAADPGPAIGSIWGHAGGLASVSNSATTNIYGDPLAHSVGDLVTIVVDLQNQITKAQNTTTAKTTAVAGSIDSLVYPNDGTSHGYNFFDYRGQAPTVSFNGTQSFNGGGTIKNQETASTTIQARVVNVLPNGVLQVEATRFSKAGEEDTCMVLTGLVRPEDLNSLNTISSSLVADLQIIQKGKGTITNDQRKGWLTKFYEFIEPF